MRDKLIICYRRKIKRAPYPAQIDCIQQNRPIKKTFAENYTGITGGGCQSSSLKLYLYCRRRHNRSKIFKKTKMEELADKIEIPQKAEDKKDEELEELEDEDEEGELSWSSDSEIGEALDYLDTKDNSESNVGAFSLQTRRPNAHGGLHTRPNSSALQPLSNRTQKFANHIRASPLEVIFHKFESFYFLCC